MAAKLLAAYKDLGILQKSTYWDCEENENCIGNGGWRLYR